MKRGKVKRVILVGIVCILLLAAASWYSVTYNEARLVVPMDYSTYVFRPQDLPMIAAILVFVAYIVYLVLLLVRAVLSNRNRARNTQVTRAVDPRLGFLGFLGLLGFGGFWTYLVNGAIFPFVFFLFFGFFGFFYEGKLSNTFIDERYRENRMRASLAANRTALAIIFLATLLLGQGRFLGNLEHTLIAYVIVVSLALALDLFLSEFLLYHYDQDEPADESEG